MQNILEIIEPNLCSSCLYFSQASVLNQCSYLMNAIRIFFSENELIFSFSSSAIYDISTVVVPTLPSAKQIIYSMSCWRVKTVSWKTDLNPLSILLEEVVNLHTTEQIVVMPGLQNKFKTSLVTMSKNTSRVLLTTNKKLRLYLWLRRIWWTGCWSWQMWIWQICNMKPWSYNVRSACNIFFSSYLQMPLFQYFQVVDISQIYHPFWEFWL